MLANLPKSREAAKNFHNNESHKSFRTHIILNSQDAGLEAYNHRRRQKNRGKLQLVTCS